MSEYAFCINPGNSDVDIAQKLEAMSARGVVNVGANELDPVDYYTRDSINRRAIETFKRQVDSRGMKVVTSHGVGGFVAANSVGQTRAFEHLKREVDRTAEWGCPCLVFHFRQPAMVWSKMELAEWTVEIERMGLDEFDRAYADTLEKLCDYAARQGVAIHLETLGQPHLYGEKVQDVFSVLKQVARKNAGVCIDTGHVHCSGKNVADTISRTQGVPLTLHVHDNRGPLGEGHDIYDSDLHWVPGLGTIDWVRVIDSLKKVGYQGPIIFEGGSFPGATFEDCMEMTLRNWRAMEGLADEMPG